MPLTRYACLSRSGYLNWKRSCSVWRRKERIRAVSIKTRPQFRACFFKVIKIIWRFPVLTKQRKRMSWMSRSAMPPTSWISWPRKTTICKMKTESFLKVSEYFSSNWAEPILISDQNKMWVVNFTTKTCQSRVRLWPLIPYFRRRMICLGVQIRPRKMGKKWICRLELNFSLLRQATIPKDQIQLKRPANAPIMKLQLLNLMGITTISQQQSPLILLSRRVEVGLEW